MKKFLILTIIFSLLFSISVFAQTDSGCEFECNREFESSKFECSETWAGPDQGLNKENCLQKAQEDFERCKSTCFEG